MIERKIVEKVVEKVEEKVVEKVEIKIEKKKTPRTESQIRKELESAGSASESDTKFKVKKPGLYIVQDLNEYPKFIHFLLSNKYDSFKRSLNIGVGSGGEMKFFRDIIDIKESVVLEKTSKLNEKWNSIKNKISSNVVEYIHEFDDVDIPDFMNMYTIAENKFDFILLDSDIDHKRISKTIDIIDRTAQNGCIVAIHDTKIMHGSQDIAKYMISSDKYEKIWSIEENYGMHVFVFKSE